MMCERAALLTLSGGAVYVLCVHKIQRDMGPPTAGILGLGSAIHPNPNPNPNPNSRCCCRRIHSISSSGYLLLCAC